MYRTIAAAVLLAAASLAQAQITPTGLWKTIDDDGKTEKSLVRIVDTAGVLSGKVEKIFDAAKQDAKCEECSDARKGQPVLGLTIIQGVKANAGEAGLWDGGEILDPNNGKTYKVRMKPVDGGKTLEVRGYIGMPLLGRTQTWQRVE
ncbi:MAG: DUF2147 domain-containing protein [Burkholderiales bacterium]|nr:DUF2147 domain-containing protein [Burkholderiales bacterium]